MIDLDELIAALRERAASDSPAHTLMNEAADALEAATRVPVQGEPNNDRESLITERTYGHGSITLTHYRSSGRIGVVQRGENSVMDVTDLLVFLQDSGLDEDFSRATVPDAALAEAKKQLGEIQRHFTAIAGSGEIRVYEDTGEKHGIDYQSSVWAKRGERMTRDLIEFLGEHHRPELVGNGEGK